MRSVYEQELKNLYVQLTSLGNAANESLHKAVTAYQNDDKELAHELFSDDLRINASTADIEKAAYRIIALQQPVAGDLRLILQFYTVRKILNVLPIMLYRLRKQRCV